MKNHRHISVRPVRISAGLIGNNKSHIDFMVATQKGFAHYDVTIDTALLLEMVDMLKRGICFDRVAPEGWVSFSDRVPDREGEYVMRYHNKSLCTFPTLDSLLGAYHTYGAIEWRKL